jgi:hypothetical protein
VDPAARLADYLAGQLDPDEHTALEAELARDPALRADLDAMRAADAHLAMIPPVTPPSGFEERFDAAVGRELAAVLDDATGATEPTADTQPTADTDVDELAVRRARPAAGQGLPRWVTAVSGAAAALVVLAGAGIVFSDVLRGADSEDDGAFRTQSLDGIDEEAFDTDDEMATDAADADGPLLLAGDRAVDEQEIQALLEDPDAFGIAARDLDDAAGRELAEPFAAALGAGPVDAAAEGPDSDAAEPEEQADDSDASIAQDAPDEATEQGPPAASDGAADLRIDPDVSAADRAQVGTCLQLLLSDVPDVIPTYAELVVFEGTDAIAFGLVSVDPDTGRFTRREVWIVDRDSCEVRLFTQM